MNYQSKQLVINAIYRVINSAPKPYISTRYMYNTHSSNDISNQEFNTWVNYVCQILDISYNHIGLNFILSTKNQILQMANQYGIPYVYLVTQINNELFNLIQIISQY